MKPLLFVIALGIFFASCVEEIPEPLTPTHEQLIGSWRGLDLTIDYWITFNESRFDTGLGGPVEPKYKYEWVAEDSIMLGVLGITGIHYISDDSLVFHTPPSNQILGETIVSYLKQ